jgi:hypothetical protein
MAAAASAARPEARSDGERQGRVKPNMGDGSPGKGLPNSAPVARAAQERI